MVARIDQAPHLPAADPPGRRARSIRARCYPAPPRKQGARCTLRAGHRAATDAPLRRGRHRLSGGPACARGRAWWRAPRHRPAVRRRPPEAPPVHPASLQHPLDRVGELTCNSWRILRHLSRRSLRLRSGSTTRFNPARCAASTSLIPTGSTRPVSGSLRHRHVTAHPPAGYQRGQRGGHGDPADGPSFGSRQRARERGDRAGGRNLDRPPVRRRGRARNSGPPGPTLSSRRPVAR